MLHNPLIAHVTGERSPNSRKKMYDKRTIRVGLCHFFKFYFISEFTIWKFHLLN